jgi:hypothetical protein
MASVPRSPSMNVMVDTITNAVESMFTDRYIASPPRFIIQITVCRALRDIDRQSRSTAPLQRRPYSRWSPTLVVAPRPVCPGVCPRPGDTTFARRLDGATSTPMPQPQMSSPNAFMLPKPPMSLMPSSSVPPAVIAHWNGSATGARGWPPGFSYDLDTALLHASTVTPSLRSYTDVIVAAPRPIGSGRPSSSVEGKDAPLH